jgi:hypothetical protein
VVDIVILVEGRNSQVSLYCTRYFSKFAVDCQGARGRFLCITLRQRRPSIS